MAVQNITFFFSQSAAKAGATIGKGKAPVSLHADAGFEGPEMKDIEFTSQKVGDKIIGADKRGDETVVWEGPRGYANVTRHL